VYVLLESSASRLYKAGFSDEMQLLARACSSEFLSNTSIYFGSGRVTYVVKTIVDKFEDVFKELQPLYEAASNLGFRSTTFPVPVETLRFVCDSLRPDRGGPELDRLIKSLPLDDARRRIDSLSTQDRERLLSIFRSTRTRFGTMAFYGRALELIAATVSGDDDSLAASLAFLTQLEGRLSTVLFRTFADLMGADWKRRIEVEIAPELDPQRHWTLKTLFDAYRHGVSHVPGFAVRMNSVVRADLVHSFRSILDLRNSYAHGTVYRLLSGTALTEETSEMLQTALEAGELFTALGEALKMEVSQ
jgi:hypothetical protein